MFLAAICSLSHLRSVVLDRGIQLGVSFGDQVKGRSPIKLKLLIEVPNVVHVNIKVLGSIMFFISSPWGVRPRGIHFRENLGQ